MIWEIDVLEEVVHILYHVITRTVNKKHKKGNECLKSFFLFVSLISIACLLRRIFFCRRAKKHNPSKARKKSRRKDSKRIQVGKHASEQETSYTRRERGDR